MKLTEYPDRTIAKYKNRKVRVIVTALPTNEFIIKTKEVEGDTSKSLSSGIIDGRIVVKSLKLSFDGAIALYAALGNELKRIEKEANL